MLAVPIRIFTTFKLNLIYNPHSKVEQNSRPMLQWGLCVCGAGLLSSLVVRLGWFRLQAHMQCKLAGKLNPFDTKQDFI